jgi:hypothetical protein
LNAILAVSHGAYCDYDLPSGSNADFVIKKKPIASGGGRAPATEKVQKTPTGSESLFLYPFWIYPRLFFQYVKLIKSSLKL